MFNLALDLVHCTMFTLHGMIILYILISPTWKTNYIICVCLVMKLAVYLSSILLLVERVSPKLFLVTAMGLYFSSFYKNLNFSLFIFLSSIAFWVGYWLRWAHSAFFISFVHRSITTQIFFLIVQKNWFRSISKLSFIIHLFRSFSIV